MITQLMINELTLNRARYFASERHNGQLYGNEPYTVHLDEVVQELKDLGVDDPEVLCAGYLHDTIEDTGTLFEEIAFHFGYRVAGIVQFVTDKPGVNRFTRHRNTYPYIQGNEDATFVKLADRICNVRRGTKNDMYRKEYSYFRDTIYWPESDPRILKMWAKLDELMSFENAA